MIRQKRKTVGIYIRPGRVEVRAPLHAAQADIDAFVALKAPWIAAKLALAQERLAQNDAPVVGYGAMLPWRGAEYPLLGDGASDCIWRDEVGFHVPPGLEEGALKQTVIKLYRACAKDYLVPRTLYFARLMALCPNNIGVTNAKGRWGSCGRKPAKGTAGTTYSIHFSWRLMSAEDDVIDAVIVHELAHMREMNHSAAFYAIVRDVLPNYDVRRRKLQAHKPWLL